MEKIYISGRISGLPIEEVAAKFDETETKLKAQGYEVPYHLDACEKSVTLSSFVDNTRIAKR